MKNLLFCTGVFGLLLFSACDEDYWLNDNQKINGAGSIQSKTILVDDFNEIDLENVANVYVTVGQPQSIKFIAYENILPYMEAKVFGNELLLNFDGDITIDTDKEIRIEIRVPELNGVTLSGVGNFYLTGPVQSFLSLQLDGVGNIDANELPVYNAQVEINGNGNISVVTKTTLNVNIKGLGNVYYKGNPDIETDINGLGEVVKNSN